MFVRNMDWPEDCAAKIGVRLEVITISETKYKNITETIRVETIKYPDVVPPPVEDDETPIEEQETPTIET